MSSSTVGLAPSAEDMSMSWWRTGSNARNVSIKDVAAVRQGSSYEGKSLAVTKVGR